VPSTYANSWTLFCEAPAEYTFVPSGCQTRPSQALSSETVLLTVHFAMSTIVSDGFAMPSLVTIAYLPSGAMTTPSGSVPTARLRPVGATFQPFGIRTEPSACAPGASAETDGED